MSSKPLSLLRPTLWRREGGVQDWTLNPRTAAGLMLCIAFLSLVGWLYLTQASQIAVLGYRMEQTVTKIERLRRDNALLRYQIAELETLPRIEARAKQLGLGPLRRTTYLSISGDVREVGGGSAEVPPTPGAAPPAAAAESPLAGLSFPSPAELWAELRAQFAAWVNQR